MKISTAIGLVLPLILSTNFVSSEVLRNPDVTIGEITGIIGPEIENMFMTLSNETKSNQDPIFDCEEPTETNIEFLLYTRENSNNPVRITTEDLKDIDSDKKVIVLIHGWLSGSFGYGFPQLIEAYLKRYDANVIMVDWSFYAWRKYSTSVCLLPKVAHIVGGLLCNLKEHHEVPLSSVHLVGHSLGAQMSGLTGQHTKEHCEDPIGRVTGLDPAGPLYQMADEDERLSSTDATFVDVIHTDQLMLGYYGDCGSADFYVNCAIMQPGCENIPDRGEIANYRLTDVSCDHLRALDYMAESVNSKELDAKSCITCPEVCVADVLLADYVTMGEDCSNSTSGAYYLSTNEEAPFGTGQED